MTSTHQFGGHWTDEKLDRLRKYLAAYVQIFTKNQWAKRYQTTFVDAFAGTGYRNLPKENRSDYVPMFLEETPVYDEEAHSFQKGSAQIALETEPPFDRYLFVEKNPEYVRALEQLRASFPSIAERVEIRQGEANTVLKDWCHATNWKTNRAVVFLDPYGMEVEWSTIEALATTKAVDLWLLFPLGQAVNRLLKRTSPPEGGWADRLTKFFGTSEWKEEFYRPRQQMSLFDDENILQKEANFDQIGAFFVKRLTSIFAQVADKPLPLRNSNNVPIYLLCFASSNPRGAPTAVKIAQYILNQ